MSDLINDASPTNSVDQAHPWPGLDSYSEQDQQFFHGRNEEKKQLLALIKREDVSVLYGRSGLGKTSLLQAGVAPRLRQENCLPVRLRLRLGQDSVSLVDQVGLEIEQECKAREIDAPAWQQGRTLWEYFHQVDGDFWNQADRLQTPVLIFDQFEEIFGRGLKSDHPQDQQNCAQLLLQLGDLIENRVPKALRSEFEQDPEFAAKFDLKKDPPRVLFSFREDYLADFDALSDYFRVRANSRFRLLPMSGQTAKEAVVSAGAGSIDDLAAEQILRLIDGSQQAIERIQVEPTLLSLMCRELNELRIKSGEPTITPALLKDVDGGQVIGRFYQRAFEGLDLRIKRFVEESLLSKDGSHRTNFLLDDALREPGVSEALIQTLIDRRLLVREDRGGRVWLELIHDVLSAEVSRSRDERRSVELREKARRRTWGLSILALVLLVLFAGVSLMYLDTRKANKEAEHTIGMILAEKADRSFERGDDREGLVYAAHALARLEPERDANVVAELKGYRVLRPNALTHVGSLESPVDRFHKLAFTPDGKNLLGIQGDGRIMVIDAETAQWAGPLPLDGSALDFWISPDNNFLLVYLNGKGIVKFDAAKKEWSDCVVPKTGEAQLYNPYVGFSSDSKSIFFGNSNQSDVIDIQTCTVKSSVRGEDIYSKHPVVSPDGAAFVKIVKSGKLGVSDSIAKVVGFSTPRDKYILSLRRLAGGQEIVRFEPCKGSSSYGEPSLKFSPAGKFIYSNDGCVWKISDGIFQGKINGQNIVWSGDDAVVSARSGQAITFWRTSDKEKIRLINSRDRNSFGMTSDAFSSDAFSFSLDSALFVSNNNTLWNLGNGRMMARAPRMLISPDGKRAVTVEKLGGLRFWQIDQLADAGNARDKKLGESDDAVRTKSIVEHLSVLEKSGIQWKSHDMGRSFSAFSPDGKHHLLGYENGYLELRENPSGKLINKWQGGSGSITAMAFSPDGASCSTVAADHLIKVWDPRTGTLLNSLKGHQADVIGLSFSPDGRKLASASTDSTVRLWDLSTGQVLSVLDHQGEHPGTSSFSPDGKTLATGGGQGKIRLWSLGNGSLLQSWQGDAESVWRVLFSPDGKALASLGKDQILRLWDSTSVKPKLILKLNGETSYGLGVMVFSRDGKQIGVNGFASPENFPDIWIDLPGAEMEVTDWRARSLLDEQRYGLSLQGIELRKR